MRPARSSLALVLLGVLLLANGAYIFPGNVSYEEEYRVTAEKAEWPEGDIGGATVSEGWDKSVNEWAVDRYLASGGQIRVDGAGNLADELAEEDDFRPEYVLLDDGYHRRTARLENETLVVDIQKVPREQVLRRAADNASDLAPVYRRAIENGTATTTETLPDLRRLVNASGEYYLVETSGPYRGELIGLGWREPGHDVVVLLRYVGWLSGLALVWYGGYRYANRS